MTSEVHTIVQTKDSKGPDVCGVEVHKFINHKNVFSPADCYQMMFETSESEVLIYVHSDVDIWEKNWLTNVMYLFDYKDAYVVGLGGAPRLGHPDIYKTPYQINQMARDGYMSNQRDWEVHGERDQSFNQVAVVDAFFMAIRRDFLVSVGGWPTGKLTHHCLDTWICLEAARRKKKVMMCGIDCTHHGGSMSIGEAYQKAGWLQGGSTDEDHRRPHRFLYEEYRDCLPVSVTA